MAPLAPLMFGYISDRSPTGVATALLVSRESIGGAWTFLPDEGGARRAVHGPVKLYATRDDAVLAARFRWSCIGGRPRKSRPIATDTIF